MVDHGSIILIRANSSNRKTTVGILLTQNVNHQLLVSTEEPDALLVVLGVDQFAKEGVEEVVGFQ